MLTNHLLNCKISQSHGYPNPHMPQQTSAGGPGEKSGASICITVHAFICQKCLFTKGGIISQYQWIDHRTQKKISLEKSHKNRSPYSRGGPRLPIRGCMRYVRIDRSRLFWRSARGLDYCACQLYLTPIAQRFYGGSLSGPRS